MASPPLFPPVWSVVATVTKAYLVSAFCSFVVGLILELCLPKDPKRCETR